MRSQSSDCFHIKACWSLLRDGCKRGRGEHLQPSQTPTFSTASPLQSCGLWELRGDHGGGGEGGFLTSLCGLQLMGHPPPDQSGSRSGLVLPVPSAAMDGEGRIWSKFENEASGKRERGPCMCIASSARKMRWDRRHRSRGGACYKGSENRIIFLRFMDPSLQPSGPEIEIINTEIFFLSVKSLQVMFWVVLQCRSQMYLK